MHLQTVNELSVTKDKAIYVCVIETFVGDVGVCGNLVAFSCLLSSLCLSSVSFLIMLLDETKYSETGHWYNTQVKKEF